MGEGNNLRRLDAEFAEKVLELTVEHAEDGSWPCVRKHDEGGTYWESVTHYHLSQDAAWAGVGKLKPRLVILDLNGLCVLKFPDDSETRGEGETSTEALVMACLEAVEKKT